LVLGILLVTGIILAIPALSDKNTVRLMTSEKIIALFLMIDCFESDGTGADVMTGFVMLAAVVIIYICVNGLLKTIGFCVRNK
jgi:hypothetical protein